MSLPIELTVAQFCLNSPTKLATCSLLKYSFVFILFASGKLFNNFEHTTSRVAFVAHCGIYSILFPLNEINVEELYGTLINCAIVAKTSAFVTYWSGLNVLSG